MRLELAGLLAVGVLAAGSTVHAADRPVPLQPVAPPAIAPAGPAWQGIYAGITASHDLSALQLRVPGFASFDGIGGEGALAGGLLGFNHRLSQRWVGGAEIGASFARGGTYLRATDGIDYFNAAVETDWTASARVRLGYLLSPDTLAYVSGGAVVAHATYGCDSSVVVCPPSVQQTLYGWLFTGIGAETQVSSSWRVRYEYETRFLNTQSFETGGPPLEVTPIAGVATVALIRDLGRGKAGPSAAFGHAPATWTGLYAGLSGGASMTNVSIAGADSGFAGSFDGVSAHGWNAGVFGGYAHQINNLVLAVEAGYSWTNSTISASISGTGSADIGRDSYYTVRGRFGTVVNPSTMLYALLGWVHTDGAAHVYDDTGASLGSERFSRQGVEVGGGFETWVNPRLSLRAEYGYTIFDDGIFGIPTDIAQVRQRVGTATVGAVFHLGR